MGVIQLKRFLKVGNSIAPYTLEITDRGIVIIRFTDEPYQDVMGFAEFGLRLERTYGREKIDCVWGQIQSGASVIIRTEVKHEFDIESQTPYEVRGANIDAVDYCGEYMEFEGRLAIG